MSWPLIAIKEVAKVVTGKTPSTMDDQNFGGDIPFVTPAELGMDTYVASAPRTLSAKGASAIKLVPKNAVMVCCIGSLGKMAIAGTAVATNQQINSVIFDENRVDAKYGFYALQLLKPKMEAMAPSTTVAIVNKGNFEAMQIPLPPLPEQKRIAAILDKADAIRRKRQQAIQLADDFLRSVFLGMFGDPVTNPKGWDEYVLNEIADIRSGVTKGKVVKPEESVTRPYMRVANVQDGYLDLADVQQITVSKRDAEKCLLLEGDILLTEGGDPDKLGRGHVWRGEVEGCLHQNHIFSVRVNDQGRVRPGFLSAIISSPRGKRYFLKVGKQTTGIATINKSVLSEFLPFVPPISLQDKYLAVVKRVDAIKQSLAEGDVGLFYSLSQKAFSGQL
ncbi:restriction endonuclease subunit S [Pseudomonas plecoglossicida]|uniref:restriction endonuclease subunit S n=1 Tax=Pseudomonas plecoglossicida TaxID=70775 RepID=UPI003D1D1289